MVYYILLIILENLSAVYMCEWLSEYVRSFVHYIQVFVGHPIVGGFKVRALYSPDLFGSMIFGSPHRQWLQTLPLYGRDCKREKGEEKAKIKCKVDVEILPDTDSRCG